ncbi:hypothetical protein [Streptomyces triticisoli]|uniref:hypothetical protein n=1 Tax=Streptomyces triticisoli TaxID=2182797 RepID=UPI000DD992BD|nr:hypothetical protein [Streptomyces triticisoli]
MSTPQQPVPSADDFLMGGSIPSAKFPTIGTTIGGQITTQPTVEQQRDYTTGEPKFWDDGKPQMQMVVTLATSDRDPAVQDDDGTRRLYVKGQLKNAIAQAVRAAGARGLEVGGRLAVTYVRDGERKNPRFNAPKEFTAQYVPAANVALHTPDPAPAAQAAPQYQAPPPAPAAAAPAGVNPVTGEISPGYAPQQGTEPPF